MLVAVTADVQVACDDPDIPAPDDIQTWITAAVEQLKTYAQIIDVPLEVAMSPDQLKRAVARMKDRDVILIDTAGRSQRDRAKINELRTFFDAVTPHEGHLVLAGTCGETVLMETIRRFREPGSLGAEPVRLRRLLHLVFRARQ